MKKSIKIKFSFLLIYFIIASYSCFNGSSSSSYQKQNGRPQEKSITLNRVWELDIEKYSDDPFVYGDYAVLVEGNKYQNPDLYFYLSKIDLSSGKRIWQTPKYYFNQNDNFKMVNGRPVKCGPYIFVFSPAEDDDAFAELLIFDEKDGTLLRRIPDLEIKGSATLIPYKDKYLFWQSWKWEDNVSNPKTDYSIIHRFDIENQTEEIFVPKIPGNILSDLYIEETSSGGVLYYETMGGHDFDYGGGYPYPKINPVVGAYDCESGKLLWNHTVKDSVWSGNAGGESLLINDNNLFVMDYGLVCLDKTTGNAIYENLMETIDYTSAYNGGVFRGEATYMIFYDNKIFCTNGSSWSSDERVNRFYKNIQCLDAESGNLIWGDLPYDSDSMGDRPAIIDDKLFVTTYYDGLRVYDPHDGTLLGVDSTIMNGFNCKNPVYKDMVLTIITTDYRWSKTTLAALRW